MDDVTLVQCLAVGMGIGAGMALIQRLISSIARASLGVLHIWRPVQFPCALCLTVAPCACSGCSAEPCARARAENAAADAEADAAAEARRRAVEARYHELSRELDNLPPGERLARRERDTVPNLSPVGFELGSCVDVDCACHARGQCWACASCYRRAEGVQ